jgi:hypothetical protein
MAAHRHDLSLAMLRRIATLLVEDSLARALDRMAEVIEYVTGNTCLVELGPVNEDDRALEIFLKFCPLQYYRKPDRAHEAGNLINPMENVFCIEL